MVQSSAAVEQSGSRALAGILSIEVGMLFFVGQDALMKALLGDFTVWMLIVARAVVTVTLLVPTILILGAPHRLVTPFWPQHFLRALLFAFGFSLFYTAFPFMALAEVTTIFFSAPLFTALMAAVFLGEKIGFQRMGCLAIGFLGVIIAMNPTGEAFQWIAVLPLICAVSYAASQIIARKVGEQDSSLTMGLYTIAMAGVLVVPLAFGVNQIFDMGHDFRHLRWDWAWPDWQGLQVLALLGVIGMIGYILLSRAYQIASASLIAPFDYSYLPLATAMGYLLWDEVPGWNTITGMVLIVASGLYLGYREVIHARRQKEPAPTAEVAFIPGSPHGGSDLYADSLEYPDSAPDTDGRDTPEKG